MGEEGIYISHTVTVDIKIKNRDAAIKAAQAQGAQIIGEGNHRLFDGKEVNGLAFKFPQWQYPVIIDSDGRAHYDNYHGAWGNPQDLETFKDNYSILAVETECDNLGWYHERNDATGELIVHHPAGGTITVQKGGTLDAAGFTGTSCAEATLKLEQAMGSRLGETIKPQMNEVQLQQQELA